MIQKILNFLKMDFIKSTSLVFIINNVANVLNYATLIIVIALLKDDFGVWVSTNGFLALLSVPTSSLMAILVSKFSKLSENDPHDAFRFYNSFVGLLYKYKYQLLAIFILTLVVSIQTLKFENITIPFLLIISIFISLLTNINQNFLLGTLEIKKYSVGVLIGAVSKFILTISLIKLGVGLISLPLGLATSSLLTLFFAGYFIHKTFAKSDADRDYSENIENDILIGGKNTLKAMVYFAILSLFLNIDIVLSRSLLSQDLNNKYALISTFGQIAHFGPISLTALIIPFASRKDHKNIFYISNAMIIISGLFVTASFYFFGAVILNSLNKVSDPYTVWLIFVYSVFIMMYNLVFININYLISRLDFKPSIPLLGAVISFIFGLFYLATQYKNGDIISNMIYFSAAMMSITAISTIFYCAGGRDR